MPSDAGFGRSLHLIINHIRKSVSSLRASQPGILTGHEAIVNLINSQSYIEGTEISTCETLNACHMSLISLIVFVDVKHHAYLMHTQYIYIN